MPKIEIYWYNFKTISAWVIFLTLGFHVSFFPSLGYSIQEINLFLGQIVYDFFASNQKPLVWESDGLAMQLHLFLCVLLCSLLCVLIKKKQVFLNAGLVYLLAYFLLKYGFNKLFLIQFYEPNASINQTPFGELDLVVLFWSTMGKSPVYQVFLGATEVVSAIFLFSNRVRFLGLLMSLGIFIHVFFINIGFEVNVKIVSFLLILLTIICLSNYPMQVSFLFGNRTNQNYSSSSIFKQKVFFKPVVICIMLLEVVWTYL